MNRGNLPIMKHPYQSNPVTVENPPAESSRSKNVPRTMGSSSREDANVRSVFTERNVVPWISRCSGMGDADADSTEAKEREC